MANYYRRKNRRSNNAQKRVEVTGDKAILALPIEELKLNENTYTLLKTNNYNTIYDVACRTEREMYRVQTFNKKHLLHLKGKMLEKGIEFLPPKEDNFANKGKGGGDKLDDNKRQKAQQGLQQNQPQDLQGKQPSNERGNDRRNRRNNPKQNRNESVQQKRAPRVRVELPVEEWRKVSRNGKWGFNNGLKTIIVPQFDEVFSFKDGLACVETDEKFGYINPQGDVVIPLAYECAMSFSEGLAVVFNDSKCGYINKDNEVVIGFKYDAATAFENGRAKVKSDGKWETIAPDGQVIWSK